MAEQRGGARRQGLEKRAVGGLLWMLSGAGFQALLRVLLMLVLARLLGPEAFGVVGAALIVVHIALVFSNLGISSAIVQRAELEPRHVHTAFALGLFIGSLAGLLGVGGGTLLVPVLVLAQGVDQHTAQGISLLMIVPVGVVGMWSYARQGHLATARLPILLLGGAMGAWVGATGAHRVEGALLTRMFATLLLVVGARMILSPSRGTVPRSADPMGDENEIDPRADLGAARARDRLREEEARHGVARQVR